MPLANFDSPAMPLDDRLGYGESEAGMATEILFVPDAVESVKDRLTRLFGHARTLIFDDHKDLFADG